MLLSNTSTTFEYMNPMSSRPRSDCGERRVSSREGFEGGDG